MKPFFIEHHGWRCCAVCNFFKIVGEVGRAVVVFAFDGVCAAFLGLVG